MLGVLLSNRHRIIRTINPPGRQQLILPTPANPKRPTYALVKGLSASDKIIDHKEISWNKTGFLLNCSFVSTTLWMHYHELHREKSSLGTIQEFYVLFWMNLVTSNPENNSCRDTYLPSCKPSKLEEQDKLVIAVRTLDAV